VIYLDTHAVVALKRKERDRFSRGAQHAIEASDDIRISPLVLLEMELLYEIKRVSAPAERIVDDLAADIGIRVCDADFARVVRKAIGERWTRDPFDRLIVAQARLHDAGLITLDTLIHKHYPHALA
jgi:PIN domain nuclease of toxin-antitoxin system